MAEPQPTHLDYASTPVARPVSDARYRRAATLLITATLLATLAAGFLDLIYFDRLGRAAPFLLAATALAVSAILGPASRPRPAFALAAILTAAASAASILALVLVDADYRRTRDDILRNSSAPVVIVYVETDPGSRLATLELTRYVAVPAAILSPLLAVYFVARRVKIAHARRRSATA